MKDINLLLAEKFKNKDFEKSYHRTATFFRLANELLLIRKKRGLSQKELAETANTTQAVVSRLENASVKASLESVVKLAEALDAVVEVRLIPLEDIRKQDTEQELRSQSEITNDALKGIVYFNVDELAEKESENWINSDLSILSLSSNLPLVTMKRNKKLREFA